MLEQVQIPDWIKEIVGTLGISILFEFVVKPYISGGLPKITGLDTVFIGILTYLFLKARHQTLDHLFEINEKNILKQLLQERERLETFRLKFHPDDTAWKSASRKIDVIERRIGHVGRQRKDRKKE